MSRKFISQQKTSVSLNMGILGWEIKDLTSDEQTEFIASNLKDNIIRLKVIMIALLIIEITMLFLNLIPNLIIFAIENQDLYTNMYLIAIAFSFLSLGVLNRIGKTQKEKTVLLLDLLS